MDKLLESLVADVPNLAILGVIVWMFIKYLMKKDSLNERIADSCHEVQNRAIKSIDENTRVLGEVGEMLRKVNGVERRG